MNILKAFGLLVLGIIIGMVSQCSKQKSMLDSFKNQPAIHDTINQIKFVETPANTVYISKDKIIYKSLVEHDTQTFTVVKKEVEYRDRLTTQLVFDKNCQDSLKTTNVLVDTLLNQIAELSKLKVFKDTFKKKEYTIELSVLGQDVKQTTMNVIINPTYKSNFTINPKAGLNFNNGKVINASVGLGIGYKKFTLDGLYTPQTKQYGVLLGYNKQF